MTDISKATALLPCPFCGKVIEEVWASTARDRFVRGYTIQCDECGITISEEYESEVVAAWNRRAPIPEPPKDPTP